jgi:hypothetical protein
MEKELVTLEHTGTWTTIPRLAGRDVVGSKWVFRIKCKLDGSIKKYKARLVACSFTPVYREDITTPSCQWPSCLVSEPFWHLLHILTGKSTHLISTVLT